MISKLYDFIDRELEYSRDFYDRKSKITVAIWLSLAITAFINVASVDIFFRLDENGYIHSEGNFTEFAFMLNFLPYMIPGFIGLIIFIDTIIEQVTSFITEGDHRVEYFISRSIVGIDADAFEKVAFFQTMYVVLYGTLMPILFLIVFPSWIPFAMVLGAIVGVLYLARFSYRLSKRLTTHVEDPNAHKQENT